MAWRDPSKEPTTTGYGDAEIPGQWVGREFVQKVMLHEAAIEQVREIVREELAKRDER